MHKVFISYHHANDQYYKEELLRLNNRQEFFYGKPIFIDKSVDTGDISENLSEKTRKKKRGKCRFYSNGIKLREKSFPQKERVRKHSLHFP